MDTTMELFRQALTVEPSAKAWCDELGVSRNTLAVAKIRGRLSPAIAGGIAIKLGEDPQHWIAVAALEAEPESTLLQRLKNCQANWRKRWQRNNKTNPASPGFFSPGLLEA